MNIKKKGASLAFTATLLASLLATVAAPAVSGATTVGSAGAVPRAGTSSGTATFTFTEETATCFVAVPGDAAAVTNPSLRVTIYDVDDPIPGGPSEVTFSGTPVVTAPGSLGATASISGNVLSVNFTNSSDAIIEQVTVSGLTITAAAGAESGAIQARLDGSQATCVLAAPAATVTANGSLTFPVAQNQTALTITLAAGTCPFVPTGTATGAVNAGPLVFATSPESVRIVSVAPPAGGFQNVTIQNATAASSTGTSDAGTTATILTDAGATWVGDQTGRVLRYTSGPAAGQQQVITGNTATTVTTAAFAPVPTPGGGDNYEILGPVVAHSGTSDAGTTPTVLTDAAGTWGAVANSQVGRWLRYTSGPAVGQQQQITANTATTITTAAFATPPTPGGGDNYQIFSQGATNSHSAGELVSQTGVPNCSPAIALPATIGSPGTVADVLTQAGVGAIPQAVPGEFNQPARNVTLSESPSAGTGTLANGQIVTFTITSPATGAVFSSSPTLTGPGASAVCSLSVDRRSCTATIAGATAGLDTYTLTNILLDIASGTPVGTPIRVTASVSSGVGVNGAPTTIANVGRVVVGAAAQPTIFIGENDQASGQITLTESGAGFFTAGAGANNTFALCLATGETFTRGPWAVVTNAGGTAPTSLQLVSGLVGASQAQGTLYNGGQCAYWTVFSASSTGAGVIEIRGSADGTTPLPSGPNNGPRLSVPPGLAPGTTQAAILIGQAGDVVGLTIAHAGTSDLGTTATVLTDAAGTWGAVVNSQVGRILRYTSGPASGLQLTILANTATTITTAAFGIAPTPGGGDTYQILTPGGGCNTVAGCQANPAFSSMVSNAVRAFRSSVAVQALTQPVIPRGATDALAGNIVITETLNGQFKPGQLVCIQIQPRTSNNAIQDTWFDAAVQNSLPIVSTNAASGLLVGPALVGTASGCPAPPGGDFRGVAGFTVTQQSFGTLGQITISNLRYVTTADAPNGNVLVRVFSNPGGGGPGVQFSTTVSNARIGTAAVLTSLVNTSAIGVTRTGTFTTATKVVLRTRYITWRAQMSPSMSGERVQVWIARKSASGVWSAFSRFSSRTVDAAGAAYFHYDNGDLPGWISVRFTFAGNNEHGPATSLARQGRYL